MIFRKTTLTRKIIALLLFLVLFLPIFYLTPKYHKAKILLEKADAYSLQKDYLNETKVCKKGIELLSYPKFFDFSPTIILYHKINGKNPKIFGLEIFHYCVAKNLFLSGLYNDSLKEVDKILLIKSDSEFAKDLKNKINNKQIK